jgi:hypothetical protein
MELVKLPESYTHSGYIFNQISKKDGLAVYVSETKSGYSIAEIIEIKIVEASEVFGKMLPRREKLPGNESFGKYGWVVSATNIENLHKKLVYKIEGIKKLIKERKDLKS